MTTREKKSDAVAKTMGELLLKGYKMLSTSCDVCYNVLLQDRQGVTLCISCDESKDQKEQILPGGSESSFPPGRADAGGDHHSTDAAEVLLMREITSATRFLDSAPPSTDLQQKQIYIRHIRECAETIKALRSIK